jgi:hypothetical protein
MSKVPCVEPAPGGSQRGPASASSLNSIRPEILWGSLAGAALAVGGAFVLAARCAPALGRAAELGLALLPTCLLRAATGVPCPTCGGTRAAAALLSGHLTDAFAFNPLLVLAFLGIVAYVPYAGAVACGVLAPVRTGWLEGSMPPALRWGIVALVGGNWVYLALSGAAA